MAAVLECRKSVRIAKIRADIKVGKGIGKGHGIFYQAVINLHLIL